MLETLKEADRALLLFLNGKHNPFFDFVMYWASDRFVWIPFYLLLLWMLFREFHKKTFFIMLLIALMITVSDQVSSHLLKGWVGRLRPCHDPMLDGQVHLVNEYCGGMYGFFSSHASNAFALSVFLIRITYKRWRVGHTLLLTYAILVSYSRIYLGVHYPGDVICGTLFGIILSYIFARIFFRYQLLIPFEKRKT